MYRLRACPGSYERCEAAPPRPDTVWSADGTKAHTLLDAALGYNLDAMATWVKHPEFNKLSPNKGMVTAVQVALDYVYDLLQEFPDAIVMHEVFVDPPIHSYPGGAGGTCDIAIWIPSIGALFVIDYKHGAGVGVEVFNNDQLLSYVAGFIFGPYATSGEKSIAIIAGAIKSITYGVIQPRYAHPRGAVRVERVSLLGVVDHLIDLDMIISRCLNPNAPLVPGDKQCRWCDARTTCPAFEAKALSVVRSGFSTVSQINPTQLPNVQEMPVDRLAQVLEAGSILTLWLKECREHATELARSGYMIPGHKMVNTQASRRWYGPPSTVANQLADLAESSVSDFMPRKLIGITEAEKLVVDAAKSKAKGRKAKQVAAEDARQAFAFLTVKESSGNTTLVPNSDKRPAINAASTFSAVQHV
ncbi:MAG: DUF2800 domain-containing protein [Candidatus Sabulitectum sp.]|nr:DUF2800 domain-containing protein [Candidatus Sabulitectum sp.]